MEFSGATTMRLNRNVAFIQFADIENGLQMEIQMRVASRLFFVGFVEFCHMLNKLKFYFIIQICTHMRVRACVCLCNKHICITRKWRANKSWQNGIRVANSN